MFSVEKYVEMKILKFIEKNLLIGEFIIDYS